MEIAPAFVFPISASASEVVNVPAPLPSSSAIMVIPPVVDDDNLMINDFINQLPVRTQLAVQYKMQGYVDREIGDKLGISRVRVHQLLMETGEKYRRLQNGRDHKRRKKLYR